MSDLPKGWACTALAPLIERIESGLNVKCEERPPRPGERGLVRISAVTWGYFDELQSKTLPAGVGVRELARIRPGDLLISRANTIELVGAAVIVESIERRLYLSDKVLRLVVPDPFKRWVNYMLKTPALRMAIQQASSGNQLSMRNIAQERLRALTIPLAPAPELCRIADKLDAVLARVEACRERLDRVPAILKRFRRAVLTAATSGDLTVEWRANAASGRWSSKRLFELAIEIKNGLSPKPFEQPPGTPILRINAVRPFLLREDHFRFLRDGGNTSAYELRVNDLLFTRYSGSVEFVGICARVRAINIPRLVYPDKLIRVRIDPEKALSGWIEIAVNAPAIREIIERTARTSAGQTGISGKDLKELEVPTPPLAEQAEVVHRVESLFAWADRLEARHAAARAQVERLTPALLAKAFRGELVPQDPTDEPASELLKRLTEKSLANPTVAITRQGAKPRRASASQTASNVREESSS